jgi:hypothetical protein
VPRAGRAVVGVAGLDAGAVEGVDELVRPGAERDVEVLRDGLTVGDDREIAPVDVLGVVRALLAEHGVDGVVEALGRVAVGDADVNVVERFPGLLRKGGRAEMSAVSAHPVLVEGRLDPQLSRSPVASKPPLG